MRFIMYVVSFAAAPFVLMFVALNALLSIAYAAWLVQQVFPTVDNALAIVLALSLHGAVIGGAIAICTSGKDDRV